MFFIFHHRCLLDTCVFPRRQNHVEAYIFKDGGAKQQRNFDLPLVLVTLVRTHSLELVIIKASQIYTRVFQKLQFLCEFCAQVLITIVFKPHGRVEIEIDNTPHISSNAYSLHTVHLCLCAFLVSEKHLSDKSVLLSSKKNAVMTIISDLTTVEN